MALQEITGQPASRAETTAQRPSVRPDLHPQEQPTAAPQRPPPALPLWLLSLTTSALLYLCYFPVAWGWLAWVALVPWLGLVRSQARPRTLYVIAWVAGLALYWPVLQWMRVADPRMYVTWGALATYCAVYYPLSLFLLRWLERRTTLPLVLTLPVVWTALEFCRGHALGGFPWYFLGHTQHTFAHLIQISDVTGAYGVSFLVAAANSLVFETLWQKPWFRGLYGQQAAVPRWRRISLLGQGLVVLLFLLGALGYGGWRLSQDTITPGPRVALLQGNVPQQINNQSSALPGSATTAAWQRILFHYYDLSNLARAHQPDLIVWPETSHPPEWTEIAAGVPPETIPRDWQDRLEEWEGNADFLMRRWPTSLLLGLNARVLETDGEQRRYNSALLLRPNGEAAGRYDKIHRVPFGEYVPLRDTVPGMKSLAPYDFDYEVEAGSRHPRLPLAQGFRGRALEPRPYTFGVSICFEDTDPAVSRPYGGSDGQPAVDFLLNISNDGWFDGTAEHEQHLAICRFRAVESRRSVARSVNMGISAVIDSNGRVLAPTPLLRPEMLGLLDTVPMAGPIAGLPWVPLARYRAAQVWTLPAEPSEWRALPVARWAAFKKVPGVLIATIPIDNRISLYARWGDWLPWSCWGLLLIVVIWSRFRPAARVG